MVDGIVPVAFFFQGSVDHVLIREHFRSFLYMLLDDGHHRCTLAVGNDLRDDRAPTFYSTEDRAFIGTPSAFALASEVAARISEVRLVKFNLPSKVVLFFQA